MSMENLQNVRIVFDNSAAVFTPGQTIAGKVLFTASVPIELRSVQLKFKGEANTSWTDYVAHQQQIHHRAVKYSANEVLFEKIVVLVGHGDKLFLNAGEHAYPFNLSLPDLLPSTFHDDYGRVQYAAKVTIDTPWGVNETKEIHFNVFSPINLNDDPSLAEPKKEEKLKSFSCLFFASGNVKIVVNVPYTGVVPGQNIPITIELVNDSNVAINIVQVKLEKNLTFRANEPHIKTKSRSSVHELCSFQGIGGQASRTWTKEITIPNDFEVNNFKHCSIIDQTFSLKVEVKGTGVNTNAEVNMKITMGNIPLTIPYVST